MRTLIKLTFALALLPSTLSAQERFATRNGHINFYSSTPVENIEADNNKVTSVFDVASGAIEFAALIKAFEFEKALMQEHFNENYMESNTHPKANFKGKVSGFSAEQTKKAGTYTVEVTGDLTIHGVTKPLTTKATLVVNDDGTIKANSDFTVRPEDHGITIPGVVRKNIAEQIKVTVDLAYARM
ncbi:MAG: YceI family protein [Flavobacteriales bacterium]|nr:YceI family protein [Flavobacteriales bacterium]